MVWQKSLNMLPVLLSAEGSRIPNFQNGKFNPDPGSGLNLGDFV